MSSHIYEDPDLTIKFKYGNRDDREEREVDIYETSDVYTDQKARSTRHREVHTQYHLPAAQRDRFRVPALILGLLCLLLVAGLTVFYKFYVELMSENEKLTSDLERINCQFGKENQTQANTTEWKRFECSCYYISTERKNWTESRKECERRGADLLVIKTKSKHEFFRELNKHGEFWIGLETEEKTKEWSKKREWEWKWVDGSPLAYTTEQERVSPSWRLFDGGAAAVCRECAGGRIHDTHSFTPDSYCWLKIISGLI
ncbi:CD209 antigen-like protein E isoform X1 [Oreochromis aureus]|uniref:C-type lectin domain-containing protein n=1 Tax=Oreochromis aureus TaxID=47969 RepID=A0AAZ1XQJ6_OREAU|nr:CD209 antigen-like protein E isoform X1 [Oreochromis aureus]